MPILPSIRRPCGPSRETRRCPLPCELEPELEQTNLLSRMQQLLQAIVCFQNHNL